MYKVRERDGALSACLAHYKTWTFSDLVRALKSIKQAIKNTYCIVCQAAVVLVGVVAAAAAAVRFLWAPQWGRGEVSRVANPNIIALKLRHSF